jgi:hypothetical protein
MLGIAVGAAAIGRLAPALERPAAAASWVLIGTALFAIALMGLLRLVGLWPASVQQVAYGVLFCSAGTCLGAIFPASAEALLRASPGSAGDRATARAGGIMDAVDHLGAAIGALFTGTLILPAIGTFATLSFVALLSAVAGLAWLLLLRLAYQK